MARNSGSFEPWVTETETVSGSSSPNKVDIEYVQVSSPLTDLKPLTGLKPHKCPVCEGRGTVDLGFYSGVNHGSTSTVPITEQCHSCKGAGYLLIQG